MPEYNMPAGATMDDAEAYGHMTTATPFHRQCGVPIFHLGPRCTEPSFGESQWCKAHDLEAVTEWWRDAVEAGDWDSAAEWAAELAKHGINVQQRTQELEAGQ